VRAASKISKLKRENFLDAYSYFLHKTVATKRDNCVSNPPEGETMGKCLGQANQPAMQAKKKNKIDRFGQT
jgi:hypothetical protein